MRVHLCRLCLGQRIYEGVGLRALIDDGLLGGKQIEGSGVGDNLQSGGVAHWEVEGVTSKYMVREMRWRLGPEVELRVRNRVTPVTTTLALRDPK